MTEIQKLLQAIGILPESPLGMIAIALQERIERLEREVWPPDRPPGAYK